MRFSMKNNVRIARAALTRRSPVYAHFGITHRCGLTCKMCGIWRYGNRKEELELDQIDFMAGRMERLGVAQVSIGGGEPFEREDLHDVARSFAKRDLQLRILTNGVTTSHSHLDQVVDAGCRHFSVSLDSLHPARYDYICESDESWTRGVKTMLHIARRTLPLGGLPTINCVVSNLNLEELPDMVRFADAIGFAVSFLPIELLETATSGARNWERRFIRYRPEMGIGQNDSAEDVQARINHAYDTLIRMKKDGWPILNSTPYLRASKQYLLTGRFPAEGCDAGRLYFSVAPNGQFTVCHRKAYAHKSFLDPEFEEYFKSLEYERARMGEAASCEGCMRACWIDTSHMFRTMEGFFDTAKLTLRPRKKQVPSFEEILGFAKWETGPVVPTAAAK